jgi:hypothetical protein
MALKPKEKVVVDGRSGTVVRVIKDDNDQEIGADVEIAGVVDRYYSDEIEKTHE